MVVFPFLYLVAVAAEAEDMTVAATEIAVETEEVTGNAQLK